MPEASLAATVKFWEVPAVVVAGKPETVNVLADAGLMVMLDWSPVIVTVTVSVAAMLWVPAVLRVPLKVWTPASPPAKV